MEFDNLTMLVVGDLMLDHYISGKTGRISPEAPVPIVLKERSWTVPGGAANVARCLGRLGCKVRLVGLVGQDSAGETLAREIEAEGISAHLVKSRRPTSCKTRIMAHGQQLLRVDEERAQQPDLQEMTALRKNVEYALPGCQAVILSDYAKGVLLRDKKNTSLCQNVISLASASQIPVLVDPKGTDWARYAGAQCVTPNMPEFQKICETLPNGGFDLGDLDEEARLRQQFAQEICVFFKLHRILLTRGSRGMNLFEPGSRPFHVRATMREVADVSGAGDTVIATLSACVAKGLTWQESAVIANTAAGIAVGKLGTAPVDINELNLALRQDDANPKLYTVDELDSKLREWRRLGQKIVFTNGCFDLLHPGHISLLHQSAAMGDRLVVGLNSDASVKRLKGETRPLQTEAARALLLSALHDVDAVVIFDEDTPEALIKQVRPDFLVKGSDYKVDEIVGSDFVRGYGGITRVVDLVDGCSTTNLVNRMREKS